MGYAIFCTGIAKEIALKDPYLEIGLVLAISWDAAEFVLYLRFFKFWNIFVIGSFLKVAISSGMEV